MKVQISAEAEVDIATIASFIALNNPRRAASFVGELISACQRLSDQPLRYAVLRDYSREVRRLPFKGYSIYYAVDTDAVIVVHVLNDALDHRKFLDA